jgi:uncharacterized membrane protein
MDFDNVSDELFDNAIKSMEQAVDASNVSTGRYYIQESKAWLRLSKVARKREAAADES